MAYVSRAATKFPFSMVVVLIGSTRNAVVSLALWKTDASFRCKRCTGQARPIDVRLMTEATVGRYKLEVVPSFCYLGDCLSSGANSMSSCPSSSPAHFPSPPEEEFTIHVSGVPCSMQAKPGPQPHPICIACNAMTELWFTGCAVSPPRTKSYSAPADSDGMAM